MRQLKMGIRGLERIIKQNEPNDKNKCSILNTSLSYFSGKYVCIDTSEFIVRSMIKTKNYHVSGILNLLEKCIKNNVFPCFVFDGKPPTEKNVTLKERNKRKQQAHDKIKSLNEQSTEMIQINELLDKLNTIKENEELDNESDATCSDLETSMDKTMLKREIISRISSTSSLVELVTDTPTSESDSEEDVFLNGSFKQTIEDKIMIITEEKKKLKKKCYSYNETHIKDIQQLLDLIKIPYINCNCESDIICAAMCKLGIVDAVVSNDMDFIILGTPIVIRGLNFRDDNVSVYIYENIKNNLKFNEEKIIDMSLLLGCDYCQRVINIKNKFVYRIFKYFDNLDDLINNLDNIKSIKFDKSDLDDSEFISYINDETFVLDKNIDINKLRNLFLIDINVDTLNKMISNTTFKVIDLNLYYQIFINYIKNINNDSTEYYNIINYCNNKCIQLTHNLIVKKCNTILHINDISNTNITNTNHINYYNINNTFINHHDDIKRECIKREIYHDVKNKCFNTFRYKKSSLLSKNSGLVSN